jgi:hypothetical protein
VGKKCIKNKVLLGDKDRRTRITTKDSPATVLHSVLHYCIIPHGPGRSIEEDTSANPEVYRYRGVYQP